MASFAYTTKPPPHTSNNNKTKAHTNNKQTKKNTQWGKFSQNTAVWLLFQFSSIHELTKTKLVSVFVLLFFFLLSFYFIKCANYDYYKPKIMIKKEKNNKLKINKIKNEGCCVLKSTSIRVFFWCKNPFPFVVIYIWCEKPKTN